MDWNAIILAAIVAIPGAIAAWQTRVTHNAVNSRMTELLELTRKASEAKGKLIGKGRGRQRGKGA